MELIRKQDRDGLMALLTDRAVERKVQTAASQPPCSASFARRNLQQGLISGDGFARCAQCLPSEFDLAAMSSA